jgi:hypothetical protein
MFLNMARSLSPSSGAPAKVSVGDINIATAVPYRQVKAE